MAELIKFVVVGHHSRLGHAQRLAALLDAHLLIDDGNHGANWNHRRALEWAAEQTCRVIVVEDDAQPSSSLTELVIGHWLNRFPDSLVSFYLGTGRPPQYQMQIAERLIVADKTQADYITLPVSPLIMPWVMPGAVQWSIRVTRWWTMQTLNQSSVILTQHHEQNAAGHGG